MQVNRIYTEDCIDTLKRMPDDLVDCIVTDPPYELGFMGKSWDKTGVAYNVLMWRECLRVLKPGGHLLAFGGTRTYHRMTCAIEDAGFEIRDMIEWVYGSGFPKSLNIGKAVDKLQGNKRDVVDIPGKQKSALCWGENYGNRKEVDFTKGTSEWEGWGTALKPAHEPICMARKPLSEKTVAENVLKWGTGGINVDESRVECNEDRPLREHTKRNGNIYGSGLEGSKSVGTTTQGRFPANLIHDNSEEVRECLPESKSSNAVRKNKVKTGLNGIYNEYEARDSFGFSDSGNASRFFKSIIYTAKASKRDRGEGNNHATVKPIALMEYLINMISKPGQIVYDPFLGSGTTAIAAVKNNRKFIGSELNPKYVEIAERRIKPYLLQTKIVWN